MGSQPSIGTAVTMVKAEECCAGGAADPLNLLQVMLAKVEVSFSFPACS